MEAFKARFAATVDDGSVQFKEREARTMEDVLEVVDSLGFSTTTSAQDAAHRRRGRATHAQAQGTHATCSRKCHSGDGLREELTGGPGARLNSSTNGASISCHVSTYMRAAWRRHGWRDAPWGGRRRQWPWELL